MPSEVHFRAFGQEALAPALTAPGETGAAGFCAHPRTEPVLLFPGAFRSL